MKSNLDDFLVPLAKSKGQDYATPQVARSKSAPNRDFDKALFTNSDSQPSKALDVPAGKLNEWREQGGKAALEGKASEAPVAKKIESQEEELNSKSPENLVSEEWGRLASSVKTPADVKKWGQLLLDAGSLAESAVLPLLANAHSPLEGIDVTAVLKESSFLGEAMGQDLDVFFASPMPMRKLLAGLDLDISLLDLGAKFGLNPNQATTPQAFFKALGIDPDIVKSQINALKDKLGPNKFAFLPNAAQSVKKGPSPAAAGKPASEVTGAPEQLTKKAGKVKEAPLLPFAPPGEPAGKLTNIDVAKSLPKAPDLAMKPKVVGEGKQQALALPDLLSEETLQPSQILPVGSEDVRSAAGLLENSPLVQIENINLDAKKTLPPSEHGLSLTKLEVKGQKQAALNLDHMAREGAFVLDANPKIETAQAPNLQALTGEAVLGQEALLLQELKGEKKADQEAGQEKQESSGEEGSFDFNIAPLNQSFNLQTAKMELAPEALSQATNEQRQELIDKIMENANLAKAGKTQATLQFEDKALGNISMQIQVDGQEVKIKTNHGQALLRDWLGSDFAELKESLSRQNLKLVQVETSHDYGQNQDSMWRFNQGREDRKPLFFADTEDSGPLAIKKPLKQYARNIAMNPSSLSLNSRHIQLAV